MTRRSARIPVALAGFLFGLTHGESLPRCGELGSLCAAEVISHVGARPQCQLAELVASS